MADVNPPENTHLFPRLYIEGALGVGMVVPLTEPQSHYLRHVLRQDDGAMLRVFNAGNGEYLAALKYIGKKGAGADIRTLLHAAAPVSRRVHLLFSPLKKDKMDFLIEKSVELGVTDLHPVIFQRSIVREVKQDRVLAQIIEASEQCERLDIPTLHPLLPLTKALQGWSKTTPVFAALERTNCLSLAAVLSGHSGDAAYLVGPEGGISPDESGQLLNLNYVNPVNLGPRILRAETAALCGLSLIAAVQ